jgi:hypothetical protein
VKTGHRSFIPGKRVVVLLRDGTQFKDTFVEFRDAYLVLKERGKVPANRLRRILKDYGTDHAAARAARAGA